MNRSLLVLVTLAALACGGKDTTAPSPTGTLIFRLDAQTCTGTGTLTFFLDGNTLGTATLAAGASQTFTNQPAGPHVAGATEARAGGYVWQSNVTIPANGSYTAVLPC